MSTLQTHISYSCYGECDLNSCGDHYISATYSEADRVLTLESDGETFSVAGRSGANALLDAIRALTVLTRDLSTRDPNRVNYEYTQEAEDDEGDVEGDVERPSWLRAWIDEILRAQGADEPPDDAPASDPDSGPDLEPEAGSYRSSLWT